VSIQVTVGDDSEWPDVEGSRGTVTVALAKQADNPGKPRIKVAATHMAERCSVELTIEEADALQDALERILFGAAVIVFDENSDHRSDG
jgi:hypothetical protein